MLPAPPSGREDVDQLRTKPMAAIRIKM